MIGRTVSHFTITSELGKGGMGVVYKARDTKLHCDRALKFLHPDSLGNQAYRNRFLGEARLLAAVQHPNICPIQEIGEEDGQVFIAMSYLEGQTLHQSLASGPLSVHTTLTIIRDVVSGLRKAHSQGVIHRDIKPANVMITNDGPSVIMDFGLAKQSDATALTRTGAVMGTVAYMSPEQARGLKVDHRSDLWSVGAMMYEMLTGRPPFARDTEVGQLAALIGEDPDPVSHYRPEVPAAMEEVVERLLEKDPRRRYATAAELLAVLGKIQTTADDDETILLGHTGRHFRLQRWQRRRLLRATALASFVVALMVVLLYVWPGILVTTSAISSIAVMPLQEHVEDPQEAYYAEGITDELITSLAKMSALTVISRSSAAKARERYDTQEEIARGLGVQAIMEGTIERIEDRLRMSVQLVRGSTGEVLWADSFERPQRTVYALQSEIARAVAAAIDTDVSSEETQALASAPQTDPRVFELLHRARYYGEQLSKDGTDKSIRYLESALAIDPRCAEAYSMLADAYLHRGMGFGGGMDSDQAYALASAYLDSALALNPDLSIAHATMAWRAVYYDWDWVKAEGAYARAIELDPGNSSAWREQGYLYGLLLGRTEESITFCRRAKRLDPLRPSSMLDLGAMLASAGRYDEAYREFDAALALDPQFYPARIVRVAALRDEGRYQESLEAILQLEREGALEDGDQALVGMAYALAGHPDEAQAILQRLESNPEKGEFARISMAMLYNSLGHERKAVDMLVQAYEAHENWFPMYISGRELANLHDEPRIRAILDELELSWVVDRS